MRALIDSLLFTTTLLMLGLAFAGAVREVQVEARRNTLEAEAQRLYDAMERYRTRYGAFPNSYAEPRFELNTLEPLQRRGYYRNRLTGLLRDRSLDAYESPDDNGLNQEFWLEMTFVDDPSVRYVVARSDDAPLGGGKWLSGVFVHRDGRLEAI